MLGAYVNLHEILLLLERRINIFQEIQIIQRVVSTIFLYFLDQAYQ